VSLAALAHAAEGGGDARSLQKAANHRFGSPCDGRHTRDAPPELPTARQGGRAAPVVKENIGEPCAAG
jgi:hypothetical protein